jgi:hypothetical protein
MKAIGLYLSNTGKRDGKETGQSMTHYILTDGAYACAYRKLAATGWQLNWQSSQGDVVEQESFRYLVSIDWFTPTDAQGHRLCVFSYHNIKDVNVVGLQVDSRGVRN